MRASTAHVRALPYEWPSNAMTGSRMTSCVIQQIKSGGKAQSSRAAMLVVMPARYRLTAIVGHAHKRHSGYSIRGAHATSELAPGSTGTSTRTCARDQFWSVMYVGNQSVKLPELARVGCGVVACECPKKSSTKKNLSPQFVFWVCDYSHSSGLRGDRRADLDVYL